MIPYPTLLLEDKVSIEEQRGSADEVGLEEGKKGKARSAVRLLFVSYYYRRSDRIDRPMTCGMSCCRPRATAVGKHLDVL